MTAPSNPTPSSINDPIREKRQPSRSSQSRDYRRCQSVAKRVVGYFERFVVFGQVGERDHGYERSGNRW